MKFLVSLSVLLIKALIAIGDGVLFIIRLITTAVVTAVGSVVKAMLGLLELIVELPSLPSRLFFNISLELPKKPQVLFQRPLPQAAKVKDTKKKKEKTKIKKVIVYVSRPITKFKFFSFGVLFSCLFLFLPLLLYIFIQDLPNPSELSLGQIAETTKIYDRHGTLLYQIFANQDRTTIPLSVIPKEVKEATISIEDKDFYSHPGFDLQAIVRSFLSDVNGGEIQGGSTLTQQLIKNSLLTPERSVIRKFKEVILAFWTERVYSKDKILELYLNQVPYGGTAWGIEAAAENYFGTEAKDLDLAESAFLAGLTKAPTYYSPFSSSNNTLWKHRQEEVLNRMVALHYITKEEAKAADDEELIFRSPQTPIHAPHFVLYVKDLLIQKYGLPLVEKGGLSVVTSLDLPLQEKAQKIVSDEIDNDGNLDISNGAALITDPQNGDILAMIGSHDYNDPEGGAVNLTTSLRQPGSSIKVVTYSAALSHGFTESTLLDDSPVTFPGNPPYSPINYDGRFHGRIPLRVALANSLNIPAVKTLNQIGIDTMVNLAKRMGIRSWDDTKSFGLGVTLGSNEVTMLDMATVYGTLANGGSRVDLNPILSITDSKGNIIEKKDPSPVQVLDEGVAFIVSNILSDNNARAMEFGLNSPLNIPGVSVKTGTTDYKRDNWTIGYTKNFLTAVWVGNNDNSPMNPALASGITGAAPIWNKLMTGLIGNRATPSAHVIPSDVVSKQCGTTTTYYIRGTENAANCAPYASTPTPTPATH